MRKKGIMWTAVFMLFLAGCGEESGKETVKTEEFVENLFAEISAGEFREYEEWGETQETPEWIEKRFQERMTQAAYETFLGTMQYALPALAYQEGKEMELEKLELTQEDGYESFQGELKVKTEEASRELEISGRIQKDPQGLVSSATVDNMEEIGSVLKE